MTLSSIIFALAGILGPSGAFQSRAVRTITSPPGCCGKPGLLQSVPQPLTQGSAGSPPKSFLREATGAPFPSCSLYHGQRFSLSLRRFWKERVLRSYDPLIPPLAPHDRNLSAASEVHSMHPASAPQHLPRAASPMGLRVCSLLASHPECPPP